MEQRYGNTLVSSRKDGKLVYTKHLFDVPKDKSQEDINKEFYSAATKLSDAISLLSDNITKLQDNYEADIKKQKQYIDNNTTAISNEYIVEIAKQYLD